MSDQHGEEHKGLLTPDTAIDPSEEGPHEGDLNDEPLEVESNDPNTIPLQDVEDVSLTPELSPRKGKKKKAKKGKKKTKVTGAEEAAEPVEENNIRRYDIDTLRGFVELQAFLQFYVFSSVGSRFCHCNIAT
jgi:hypothetical protein